MSDHKDSPPAPAPESKPEKKTHSKPADAPTSAPRASGKPPTSPPPRESDKPPASPPPRGSGKPPASPPPRRRGATAVLALLLALLALIAVAIAGWQIWHMQRTRHARAQQVSALNKRVTKRVAGMQHTLQSISQQRQSLSDALDKVNGANQDLRQQVAGLSQRADHLEGAVASLSRRAVSGHEQLLLNQAELLLRMGKARYQLFHDGTGAARAYALAEKTLSGLDDPAYSGVRQAISSERQALLAAQPQQRNAQLAQLGTWRTQVMQWPLRSQGTSETTHPTGFWARAWHALSKVVRVHHDRGAPVAASDAHLARELVALDLAQAQAALLADDQAGFQQTLRRVDTALGRDFDTQDAAVQAARTKLAKWRKAKPAATPDLGAALEKLSNLRSVSGADDAGPATSSSTGGGSP